LTPASTTQSNNFKQNQRIPISLLVFDSYPNQNHTPIWKAIHNNEFDSIHVVYATNCSTKGYQDKGFGQRITWEKPLLEGYPHTILNNENGTPLSGWNSLTG